MTLHFDTGTVGPQERHAYWQEVVCQTFVPLECRIGSGHAFSGRIQARKFDSVTLVDIQASQQHVLRNQRSIARSGEEFVLVSLAHTGRAAVLQDGREASLEQGSFAIYDTRQPYELKFPASFHQTVIQIPYALLREYVGNVERLTAMELSRKHPIARLAFDYLVGLVALDDAVSADTQCRLVRQGIDLLSMALGEYRNVGVIPSCSHRNSFLYRVKNHIRAQLHDTDLSLSKVAAVFNVSPRYVNSLFQDEETSFGRFLIHVRLQQCAIQLRNDTQKKVPISTIAYRAGFTDMTHFSRVFKARYGHTARTYRDTENCAALRDSP